MNKYLIILCDFQKINIVEENIINAVSEQLGKLDANFIARISEISKAQKSYDENAVILYMEDGNRLFASVEDLTLLENYNEIIKSIKNNQQCIQLDSANNSAFQFKCP